MPASTRRQPRTVPRLTRRGTALVVIGAVLAGVSLWFDLRDVLLLAFVAIAMPVVGLCYAALRIPKLAVTRVFAPATVAAGGSTRVRLTVQNRSRRPFDGARWRDEAPAPLLAPGEEILPGVGPWERTLPSGDDTVRLDYLLRTPRRGAYPVGPLQLSLGDPFGLAVMRRAVGGERELLVTPRVTAIDGSVARTASVDGTRHGLQRRTHPNSDELIAREYRYGDPLRRVNWAATARRGELMVREEEQRGDAEARLLLDSAPRSRGDDAHRGDAPDFEFELAVEVAASIGIHLLDRGYRLRLDPLEEGAPGRGEYREPGGGAAVLLEDLARIPAPGASRRREHGGARPARDERAGGAARLTATRDRRAPMPGFAVLVRPAEERLAELAALRPAFAPAVAVVLPTVAERSVDALERADWRVVRIRRAAELTTAFGPGRMPVPPAARETTWDEFLAGERDAP
ncbi:MULTISPECIES: DUF58 domain-containing protein [Agromyces]|uniref:DUF58 domain-containing protein n=1 Tax=Agromyces TaxID=33877 RepID=UPI001E5F5AC3|nr:MULTISPECIES: DUF58 domain-containing protein [Agromyces]MCD1569976.1 DUF58 domain-containing protein [Agromyces mediolanus]GLU89768.1 hypothetical protein Agsp01_20230 [Agromyces sp. NBRC 114283]